MEPEPIIPFHQLIEALNCSRTFSGSILFCVVGRAAAYQVMLGALMYVGGVLRHWLLDHNKRLVLRFEAITPTAQSSGLLLSWGRPDHTEMVW